MNMNTILEVPEIQVEEEEYDSIGRLDSVDLTRRSSMQLSTTSKGSSNSLWHGRRRSRSARLARVGVEEFKDHMLSLKQVPGDADEIENEDLLFNPSHFKAKRLQKISQEAKRILQMHMNDRTEKEIQFLQIALRRIKAFAAYPQRMQQLLCKAAWYECYDTKRAIVRQGHPPLAFYFILSGSVAVTVMETTQAVTRTLCFLYRGMQFGELALLTHSKRQTTVISKTTVELLCISKFDFEEIFMSGGLKSVLDPDHNKFIKNISFLKGWPIRRLSEDPKACMFHYFAPGYILVKDSNLSDWIFVVKSGSVSVLKKLQRVDVTFKKKERRNPKDTKVDDLDVYKLDQTSMSICAADYLKMSSQKLPQITRQNSTVLLRKPADKPLRDNVDLEIFLDRTLPGMHSHDDRLGIVNYDEIIDKHKRRVQKSETIIENDGNDNNGLLSPQSSCISLPPVKTAKGAYFAPTKKKSIIKKALVNVQAWQPDSETAALLGKQTLTEHLQTSTISDKELTPADLDPTFIVIQVLERSQFFGVAQALFTEPQPSLSLVSNGAECIMIKKSLYLKYCSEEKRRSLRESEVRLPSDEELQEQLKQTIQWEYHRAKTYKKCVEKQKKRTKLKKQFAKSHAGEYNFRIGPV
ncbi:DgyrCDS10103 [Dimorphilus gyrociliatus]|uniref:DgyrCDS10103 n=1 Tax=Dimorphilus gyrociliatus TaxID=2664684 RepID=A0A7I8VZ45_9ANNE|nr:DgyrCDS10103 [Dimorphilus gyrociliatus]